MLTPATLADHYAVSQIAVALGVGEDVVQVMIGDTAALAPDDVTRLTPEADRAARRVQTNIAGATGEVASAVGVRYDFSAVEDAPMVARLVADRTMIFLHGDVVPEDLVTRRADSIRMMGMLKNGTRILHDAAGQPYPQRATMRVRAPDPLLTGLDGLLDAY